MKSIVITLITALVIIHSIPCHASVKSLEGEWRFELERSHWKSSVWLDKEYIGSNLSLSTAHVYDIGVVQEAGVHQLTVRIDNYPGRIWMGDDRWESNTQKD